MSLSVHSVGNTNFRSKAPQKEVESKSSDSYYKGKVWGSAIGAGGGAAGAWYIVSSMKEEAESIKTLCSGFFKLIEELKPDSLKGIAQFYEKNSPELEKTIKSVTKGFAVISVALATFLGLGVGAIVDVARKKTAKPAESVEDKTKTDATIEQNLTLEQTVDKSGEETQGGLNDK